MNRISEVSRNPHSEIKIYTQHMHTCVHTDTPTHLYTHLRGPLLNEKKGEPPEKERECKGNVGGESEANVFHLTVLQLGDVCACVCVCVCVCVCACVCVHVYM